MTTATGYVLANEKIDAGFVLPVLGIFLLACGSSVLNHIQERKTDAIMERTRNRPLVTGEVSIRLAVLLSFIYISSGVFLIYIGSGIISTLLGILALIWYNAIYTPLKRITPHAVIPGSVIGSIPPLVGWVVGGADLFNYKALVLAFFFYV
ncbi:UbiA family prenyltransferase [Bacteroidota bacterium]